MLARGACVCVHLRRCARCGAGPHDRSRAAAAAAAPAAVLRELLKASTRTPQEKSDYPVSGTQAIGWFHGEVVDTVPRMPKNSCQEVKYAESYVAMTGLNPYMKKK